MLFQRRFLEGIREGTVTLAFRRWRRCSVRTGGTLLTPVGALPIVRVSTVEPDRISTADAKSAGYECREALLADLNSRTEGTVYRIELGELRPDPRIALRSSVPVEDSDYRELIERLSRLDARSEVPWTRRTLTVLRDHPEVRAAELCRRVDQDRQQFKLNVRKLKGLGLTESYPVGYRLSPRGLTLLEMLKHR